jgi:CheY-like chemotaxis protein
MSGTSTHPVAASCHTDAGRATATARRRTVGLNGTGVGREPEASRRSSDPFAQGDAGGRRPGLPSLGLGRDIAGPLGGSPLAVSPGRERGVVFPRGPAAVSSLAPATTHGLTPPAGAQGPRGSKILLVEDYQDIACYLTLVLRQHGHAVTVAASLAEARAAASRERFHLLISDIDLPDGTGLELMRELGGGSTLPGLAISGFGSREDVELTRKAGFSAHLTKPVGIRRLVAMVSWILTPQAAPAVVPASDEGMPY